MQELSSNFLPRVVGAVLAGIYFAVLLLVISIVIWMINGTWPGF